MFTFNHAFSSFSVDNLAKAKEFYEQTLGMQVSQEPEMPVLHIKGDHEIIIYEKGDHQPASFTVLNLSVESVSQAVDQLTAAGVHFLQYDGPIKTDERGIFRDTKGGPPAIAWFTDPAGNIISVLEGN
ncbi:VOC family protein [Chitinophaga pendula]|uniref:VOC family protein n=1 Tax=Chitinophaga TaxID=79328 RepID=UPI000BAF8359|nr:MULTISPECIES: VOC family protein [Chitinophaga]ASZ14933.1 glyoxalase [Chitinophaga sp. MD30]UCJ05140.1 VOC family protein [Chitinophaga pendula]